MARRLSAWLLLASLAACRTPLPPRAAPAREPASPSDLLPNDLDFVVRIDFDRLRSEPSLDQATRGLAKAGHSALLTSILPALERSRAVYLGGRIMSDGLHGDGVVAIEPGAGAGRETVVPDASFHRVGDPAAASVEIYERPTSRRDDAMLEVVLPRGGIVLATPAEVDAVLRVLRSRPDPDRLDPPARGLASFAGRVLATTDSTSAWPASSVALVREVGRGLRRYTGSIEGGDALHVELDLIYRSAEQAEGAASFLRAALGRLAEGEAPLKSVYDSAKLAREGERVSLRATVPFAVVGLLH